MEMEEKMTERHCHPRLMRHDQIFQVEDILTNVLSRLPVKILMRFRCVCKRWRNLITDDPYFIQLHSLQYNSKQPLFLISSTLADSRERSPYSISLKSMDRETNLISRFEVKCANIYAKLVPTRFDLVCIQDDMIVHICNPSTHEFITLPEHHLPLWYSTVGFGYVQSTDEYKVVSLLNPDYDRVEDGFRVDAASFKTKCHVFTLGMERRGSSSCASSSSSWAWREVMDSPYLVNYSTPPAFVNGAIHWLVLYNFEMDVEVFDWDMVDPNYSIIAFDVEREEFRLVSHPEGCPDVKSLQYHKNFETIELQLVELGGLLCLSCAKDSKMDIWMLNDYYYESGNDHISGTWVKEYRIDVSGTWVKGYSIYLMNDDHCNYYAPRDIEDTEVLIESYMNGLEYYHLQSKRFKEFMRRSRQMPNLRFSFYLESLRSLKQFAQNWISSE
ncbi:F-box/kelch-repeat protein At3g23880-like [Telopea speciosissima]|uniref:F-box/kelch-repeat protein At3g23880-like n=1 Tax=Telopea speciosissima TaxID=54955 RepID=UPI001CC62348|nr:F-box/kelch-repeat protein At3g23880-like [Telopea speciosissima]